MLNNENEAQPNNALNSLINELTYDVICLLVGLKLVDKKQIDNYPTGNQEVNHAKYLKPDEQLAELFEKFPKQHISTLIHKIIGVEHLKTFTMRGAEAAVLLKSANENDRQILLNIFKPEKTVKTAYDLLIALNYCSYPGNTQDYAPLLTKESITKLCEQSRELASKMATNRDYNEKVNAELLEKFLDPNAYPLIENILRTETQINLTMFKECINQGQIQSPKVGLFNTGQTMELPTIKTHTMRASN